MGERNCDGYCAPTTSLPSPSQAAIDAGLRRSPSRTPNGKRSRSRLSTPVVADHFGGSEEGVAEGTRFRRHERRHCAIRVRSVPSSMKVSITMRACSCPAVIRRWSTSCRTPTSAKFCGISMPHPSPLALLCHGPIARHQRRRCRRRGIPAGARERRYGSRETCGREAGSTPAIA